MRKSLQKMPPSGHASRLASLPAALVAVDVEHRRGPKRNGAAYERRARVAVSVDDDQQVQGRLRLLEGLVGRTEIVECAQLAIQWLDDALDVSRALCLVKPVQPELELLTMAASGLGQNASSFGVSLDDWNNPLVVAFN